MFLNIRLPEDISYGASGGPGFSTNVVVLENSAEHRNINWEAPRYSYSIGYDSLNSERAKKLMAFFCIVRGRAYSFRFKDWFDYDARDQKLLKIDGQRYQLVKLYKISDNFFYDRRISKPCEESLIIKNGNEMLIENKDYKIDYDSGIVEFLNNNYDPEKLLVNFDFDVSVRFESDSLDLTNDSFRIYSWKSIKLIETRE